MFIQCGMWIELSIAALLARCHHIPAHLPCVHQGYYDHVRRVMTAASDRAVHRPEASGRENRERVRFEELAEKRTIQKERASVLQHSNVL